MRYRARVEYDGTDFAGFQAQPGRRTVQGELEKALGRLAGPGWGRIRVAAAGRTDAGVHALGQVIAFSWPGRPEAAELHRGLGALLPRDIGVYALRQVAAGYDPRRAARCRWYRYSIWNGPRSPLRERFALGFRGPVDAAAMDVAAQALVGRRDFVAFARSQGRSVRTLHRVRVRRTGHLITVDVIGDAFLRQMVRSIVAALLRVGRGDATGEELAAALRGTSRAFDGAVAPPQGLCLRRVVLGTAGGSDKDMGTGAW